MFAPQSVRPNRAARCRSCRALFAAESTARAETDCVILRYAPIGLDRREACLKVRVVNTDR